MQSYDGSDGALANGVPPAAHATASGAHTLERTPESRPPRKPSPLRPQGRNGATFRVILRPQI